MKRKLHTQWEFLAKVRAVNIRAEIFPDAAKMKKQMSYANAKNIPFVAIVGENEMNEGKVMLKNMETGEQNLVSADELIAIVEEISGDIRTKYVIIIS